MNLELKDHIKNYYAYWLGVNNLYEEWAKTHGLSSYGLFTLHAIWEADKPISQKKISENYFMPKQTVNTIIKKFIIDGYITFTVMPEDKRNKFVILTESGREYADDILAKLYRLEKTVMENMGDQNRADMTRNNNLFLAQLKVAIDKENKK